MKATSVTQIENTIIDLITQPLSEKINEYTLNAVSLTESFVFKEKAFLFNSMPSREFPVWTH